MFNKGSDAILILTEWEDYFNIDWEELSQVMRKPAWIFDARSVLKKNEIRNDDLKIWRIGDGSTQ